MSNVLSGDLNADPEEILRKFLEREKESSTVIGPGLAIPHIFVEAKNVAKVILVRAKEGIIFPGDQSVRIAFVLVGSAGEHILHLKILAAIAQITQNPGFVKKWLEAETEEELQYLCLPRKP